MKPWGTRRPTTPKAAFTNSEMSILFCALRDIYNNVRRTNMLYLTKADLASDAPDLGDRVRTWANRHITIDRDFGLCSAVLISLNDVCRTSTLVRKVWPSISFLAGYYEHNKVVIKPEEVPSKVYPQISYGLLQAIREASSILTLACMLDTVVPQYEEIRLVLAHKPQYNEHGFSFDAYGGY